MHLKKQDFILLFALAGVALVLAAVLLLTKTTGARVVVRVDGEQIAEFALNEDTTYCIEGANGGTNDLVIQDGAAWLEDADCPDKLCVNKGKISYTGQSIICLPHKVTVTIEDDGETAKVDAVAT